MSADMFPDGFIDYILEQESTTVANETCKNCGKQIRVAIFKNGDHCSETCRKQMSGEIKRPSALADAGITNMLAQPTGEVDLRGIG